ncbi:probable dolichyl pyrophosphate Glc1Man9GlcNAc2 alpha-1,3-glucosyltransferase [Pollicipes pollicipes]|uniref:probable dolichyl pyrophosphate Glc1Man9GlcNAc2 alpha-1,3-glucosyltransferase n=1 Tax=Pollicipes pollicipes TaxID=41117 RepID=UPI001885819B|nr:probable dolichyl pyrophosphate Glc1Man9GlcNAc2 alpha-1,3-glucosyltransferase [Pollicipes pollicipes]
MLKFTSALTRCADTVPGQGTHLTSARVRLAVLTLGSAGLLIVDHIHFQYNGLLLGLLLMSYACMTQGRYLKSALLFTVLLNMKHIFLYLAPAYFVFLLAQLLRPSTGRRLAATAASGAHPPLGLVVLGVFAVSLGRSPPSASFPRCSRGCFPFKRGSVPRLLAPNFWVLYNLADKLAVAAVPPGVAAMTGGLVQETSHALLPTVPPTATFLLSGAAMLPALVACWRRPADTAAFLRALVQCALGSFLFGWHVHEKALLLAVVPLAVLALRSQTEARLYLLLSAAAHVSLFPLLHGPAETLGKVLAALLHAGYAAHALPATGAALSRPQAAYLAGLAPLVLYHTVGHRLLGLHGRWPFVPLLLTSLYCALGVLYCWLALYRHMLFRADVGQKVKQR